MWEAAKIIQTFRRLEVIQPTTIFGAGAHHFKLNPPLSELDIAAFENAHAVSLPSDFRSFLAEVGNGGAGPFYGIFPLGQMDDGFAMRAWKERDGFVGVLSQPFLLEKTWNDVSRMPDSEISDQDEYWRQTESFEKDYWASEIVNGAIPICHKGCAIRIWLIVRGVQTGHLWEDRRSEYKGLSSVKLSDGSPATFFHWYEEWLEQCKDTLVAAPWPNEI